MSNLIEISSNLGSYLTSLSPQIKDDSLQYYLSGSLATMIMASAENLTEIELDESNNLVGERNSKSITKEQREKIAKFSRKLGIDIDVVNVNGSLFRGSPKDNRPHAQNVIEHVPQVLDLMSWQPTMAGSMYIDSLEGDREITHHSVAKVKTPNGEIYVTAPPEQLAHKLSETIWLSGMIAGGDGTDSQKDKYEKDIRDVSSMFYGYKDLYDKDEFLNRIYSALNEKDELLSSIHNPMHNREDSMKTQETEHIMGRIIDDSANYLANIADEQSSEEISEFFVALMGKRKSEIERMNHTETTPLQQREAELSALKAEAKEYEKEEAVLQAQLSKKEGQNIGEK